MAYCTTANIRDLLDIESTKHDALITSLIARVQAAIDGHTHRTFEASEDSTRKVSTANADGLVLWLDDDLCAITSITNNADGATETITIDTHAVTVLRYSTPYHGIKLLASADKAWQHTDDAEEGISIVGRWAYSATAPADVVDVCTRLTEYLYRGKDTGEGTTLKDETAMAIMSELDHRIRL